MGCALSATRKLVSQHPICRPDVRGGEQNEHGGDDVDDHLVGPYGTQIRVAGSCAAAASPAYAQSNTVTLACSTQSREHHAVQIMDAGIIAALLGVVHGPDQGPRTY